MKRREPPFLATWALRHLTPGGCDESLHGDLLEQYGDGRSRLWFWRQVWSVLLLAALKDSQRHWTIVAFAAVWSLPSAMVFSSAMRWEMTAWAQRRVWTLEWPYSTIVSMALMLVPPFIYLWAGVAVYVLPNAWVHRNFSWWGLMRGFCVGASVLVGIYLGFVALDMWEMHGFTYVRLEPVTLQHFSLILALFDLRTLVEGIPYFIGLVFGIRASVALRRNGHKQIVA